MTQNTKELLKTSIENLEIKRNIQLKTVNDSYDPGTFRQSATVLDALGGWNSIDEEIYKRKKALNNAVIIKEGESVDGFTIGTKLIVRFEGEKQDTIFKIGTPWDAAISAEITENFETVSFEAPIVNRLNQLKPGDETIINNGRVKLIDIFQPNKQ